MTSKYPDKITVGINPPRQFRKFLPEDEIQRAVLKTAEDIHERYRGKNPVFVGVLTGCFMYMADIVRATNLPCTVDFIKLSSYGDGIES